MSTQDTDILAAVWEAASQHPNGIPAEVETELLKLLENVGRARCEHSSTETIAQPPVKDLFAGTTDLPEVQGIELNSEILGAALVHHGGLLVRGLYNQHQLSTLREVGAAQEDLDRQENWPLSCSKTTFFKLLEVYQGCGLLDSVRGYLDDEPVIFGERTKLRHFRSRRDYFPGIPWHQDVNFFGKKSYAVNCWAAVTPCGERNPGLSLLPRRTDDIPGWGGSDDIKSLDYGKSVTAEDIETIRGSHPLASPIMQPGDALLFDEMTVHQSNIKPWDLKQQIVTVTWFFRASGFPPQLGTPLAV